MVLKDCSRCMVYTPKGQRLSEARVVHAKDSVTLFFSDYKFQDSRFQARVDFYDDQCGLIVAKCEVTIRRNPAYLETGEPWTADCRILDVKNVVQRQRDIRAKVYLEVEFELGNGRHFYGTIRNLSAGGLYMTTVQPLKRGMPYPSPIVSAPWSAGSMCLSCGPNARKAEDTDMAVNF